MFFRTSFCAEADKGSNTIVIRIMKYFITDLFISVVNSQFSVVSSRFLVCRFRSSWFLVLGSDYQKLIETASHF